MPASDVKPSLTVEAESTEIQADRSIAARKKLDSEQIASKVIELMLDELRVSRMRGEN